MTKENDRVIPNDDTHEDENDAWDYIDETSWESFPASDPPAWSAKRGKDAPMKAAPPAPTTDDTAAEKKADSVEEAGQESFPASDPPSSWAG